MPLSAGAIIGLIGAAGSAAGAGLSIAGNIESKNALAAQRAEEAQQQAQLNKHAQGVVQARLANTGPTAAATQMATGAQSRAQATAQLATQSDPIASALPATGTSTATSGAQKRSATTGNAWNILNSNAKAQEGSYGDWQNQQNLASEGAADQLGVIKNFSQQDAALSPTEDSVALQQGDQLGAWGGIVSQLGQVASIAGKVGTFGSATPAGGNLPYTPGPGGSGVYTGATGAVGSTNLTPQVPAWNGGPDVWTNLFDQ